MWISHIRLSDWLRGTPTEADSALRRRATAPKNCHLRVALQLDGEVQELLRRARLIVNRRSIHSCTSAPEARALPSASITRHPRYRGPIRLPGWPLSCDDVEGATSASPGSPPITQIAFLACRAQYPDGPNRCLSVSSPFARPSPVNWRVGIHDFTFEACSGFTRVTACKIAARPTADSCPEASIQPVAQPNRSVATMSHRQLHRWILLPLTICPVGAHS